MPTSYHLVIGTAHPFAHALTATLGLVYGKDAVRTAADTKVFSDAFCVILLYNSLK